MDMYSTSLVSILENNCKYIYGIQVYNDAHILEKLLKDKRKELGPLPDDDDMASPKLKLSKATSQFVIPFNLSRIDYLFAEKYLINGECI